MICGHLGFFNTASTRTHVGFQFSTHAAAGGNVAPNSAFEAADLRIYRAADGAAFSATQRSSANGVTMTSPFDSLTGYHDVDIDLTDNTDAGFYAAGYRYIVTLAPDETVDGQTITGIPLAMFEIGVLTTNVTQFGGTAGTFAAGIPEVKVASLANNAITAASINADAITAAKIADGAIDAGALAADCITAAKLAADVTTELQSGLATAAALDTVDNFLDTEIATIVTAVAAIQALLDDARGEPGQGAPPVNPDLATKIDYLYKAWRNKKTQTATEFKLFADDASTVDQKATVSDDATTATFGEMATGA